MTWRVEGEASRIELFGIAFVVLRPATSRFARWHKRQDNGWLDPAGGWVLPAPDDLSPGHERQLAWAREYAAVACRHGITATTRDALT